MRKTKQEFQKLVAENKLLKTTHEYIIKQQQQKQQNNKQQDQQRRIQIEQLQRQEKRRQKNASMNRNTEKGTNEYTAKVNVKTKMKILSKTIGMILWIAMIVVVSNGNFLLGRRNRWAKWRLLTNQLRAA